MSICTLGWALNESSFWTYWPSSNSSRCVRPRHFRSLLQILACTRIWLSVPALSNGVRPVPEGERQSHKRPGGPAVQQAQPLREPARRFSGSGQHRVGVLLAVLPGQSPGFCQHFGKQPRLAPHRTQRTSAGRRSPGDFVILPGSPGVPSWVLCIVAENTDLSTEMVSLKYCPDISTTGWR